MRSFVWAILTALLEHERFVGVKSRKQLVVVGELYLKEGGD
jgi:hypothetical protein